MLFRQIVDPKLAQYAYLVGCQQTKEAVIVDPERDVDRYIEIAADENLRITAVVETHIHADFLSGAREFAERHGTTTYLSDEGDANWKYEWARSREDVVFLKDGDVFHVGNIEFKAVHTPGHTPEHLSYVITDRGSGATKAIGVVTGDFVFVGDLGRPDLLETAAGMHGMQEPAAQQLFRSLPRFTELEDYLQVWPGHGAGSACGKALGAVPVTTVGYERLYNASLDAASRGERAFVDAILAGQSEPPLYFARMKQANKLGPDLLGDLPSPRQLSVSDLERIADSRGHVVVDTRLDRSAFMEQHLPGSLYAPMNKTFNTVVGSLLVDPSSSIVLIVDSVRVEEAVRDLVRIGFDNVTASATPETLAAYFAKGGRSATIPEIGFDELERLRADETYAVIDTRYQSEYDAGHVPGAIAASYTRLPEYLDDRIPRDRKLLVYCGSGARSAAASSFLARQDLDVRYVNGEFSSYAARHEQTLAESLTS